MLKSTGGACNADVENSSHWLWLGTVIFDSDKVMDIEHRNCREGEKS